MVEFAIAQFNGTGTTKNEAAAAQIFLKAAQRGSPIAQDRLARILMAGRGMPADPIGAIKWHIIAKAAGAGDPDLDVLPRSSRRRCATPPRRRQRRGCRPSPPAARLDGGPARGQTARPWPIIPHCST